jgi:hypothetical protein
MGFAPLARGDVVKAGAAVDADDPVGIAGRRTDVIVEGCKSPPPDMVVESGGSQ